jgi:low temperature requirement protein LtrA
MTATPPGIGQPARHRRIARDGWAVGGKLELFFDLTFVFAMSQVTT